MPQKRMATLLTERKPRQTARADEDIVDEDIRKVSAARVRRGPRRVWDVCREAAGTWEAPSRSCAGRWVTSPIGDRKAERNKE